MTNQAPHPSAHIMVMAAGTGGHIFPALAVAQALQQQGLRISWLGTPQGMEQTIVGATDIPILPVRMQGLRGNGLKRLLVTPFRLVAAIVKCMAFYRAQHVNLVVGFGGYVCAPGGIAAKLMGIPLVIHEQNAIAGLSNTVLSKLANLTLLAFANALPANNKTCVVGNPIREAISQLPTVASRFANRAGPMQVLIVGGSLGAQALNNSLPNALAALNLPLHITHQCGQAEQARVQAHYAPFGQLTVSVTPFIQDMAAAYGQADLIICRAGALTVSEVAAAGVAAVFVPLPSAVDDHQTRNAQMLVAANAALLCPQAQLGVAWVQTHIGPLLQSRQQPMAMALNSQALATPQALSLICAKITALLPPQRLK
jgi:UDP-N-acetylglucosamine--N-acetylmuramyl-(pentapeptide) pyrophosphoryl-undecaprenol N-acetylglucosamine transferase